MLLLSLFLIVFNEQVDLFHDLFLSLSIVNATNIRRAFPEDSID